MYTHPLLALALRKHQEMKVNSPVPLSSITILNCSTIENVTSEDECGGHSRRLP